VIPQCPDCLQRVNWALTAANRKWLALNPLPDPAGNQAAYRDGTGRWLTRQVSDTELLKGWEKRYKPHLATCTARNQPESEDPECPDSSLPPRSSPWAPPRSL
jgi:hypothetical protein